MRRPTDFEWEDAKAELNIRKHGVPFEAAIEIFADPDPDHVAIGASREEDGEDRRKAIGMIQGRVFTLVFVERGPVCRLISARRANRKEDRVYGKSKA